MKDKLTKHILDLGACDVGFSYCEDAPSPFKNAVTIVAKLSDFVIDEIDDEDCLVIVEDDKIIDDVFEEYYKLLKEEGVDVEGNTTENN